MENALFIAVLAIIVFDFLLENILDWLNMSQWKDILPDYLKDFYGQEKYLTAKSYNKDKNLLGSISGAFSFVLILILFLTGSFAWFNDLLSGIIENKIILALVYFALLGFASDLLGIPFSLFNIFKIEEKYGFNKTTPKTYVLDKLKSYLLSIVLGGGIGYLLLWLIFTVGANFWIYAFAAVLTFSLLMNYFATTLILPLFNKLSPLEEGDLRKAIEEYSGKVNFPLKNIYVIDGSKRSSKANAFFSGFGKRKKIVLYDTLIEKHSVPELLAVLAHEVGHYKKKHIVQNMVISSVQLFVMFYILSLLLFNDEISKGMSAAFGIKNGESVMHINLMAIAILFEPLNLVLGLFGNILSRKHEYQADEFAVKTTNKIDLPNSLKKMSIDHLSNLDPHPAYVFFYYSHPPTVQRIAAMQKVDV